MGWRKGWGGIDMTNEKEGSKYYLYCDICGEEEEEDFGYGQYVELLQLMIKEYEIFMDNNGRGYSGLDN